MNIKQGAMGALFCRSIHKYGDVVCSMARRCSLMQKQIKGIGLLLFGILISLPFLMGAGDFWVWIGLGSGVIGLLMVFSNSEN